MLYAFVVVVTIIIIVKIYCRLTLAVCTSPVCLVGKTALVTGGNSGIGYETALALAGRGCRVIIADKDNCTETRTKIINETGNTNIAIKQFNLASLQSIRELAKDINDTEKKLDILINNAGVSGVGNSYTKDGVHMAMQVNHFGPFLLTHLLLALLKKSSPSRIIFVSSEAARLVNRFTRNLIVCKDAPITMFSEFLTYANSKFCNVVTANELAHKLKGTGVTVNSCHPGIICTAMVDGFFVRLQKVHPWLIPLIMGCYQYFVKGFMKTAEEGAQTTIHLAVAQEVENVTGKYFAECQVIPMPLHASDMSYSKLVWKTSEELVKLAPAEML